MAASQVAVGQAEVTKNPKRVAGVIISGHGFQHMYADGFLVLLDPIYQAFGLNPISAGLLQAVRQGSSGLLSMGGGFLLDLFSGKRGILLAGSLFIMGLGYGLAAAAPNYTLLLVALALGSGAASFWHPIGLGILSYTFPKNRAFVVSLHRSSGSLGELVTPGLIALAALALTWRGILWSGFLLITVVAVTLFVVLNRLGFTERKAVEKRSAGDQFRSMGQLFKDRALPTLLLLSGMRGMADRAFIAFFPLFVGQGLRAADPDVSAERVIAVTGIYYILLAAGGVVVSPLIGHVADRVGRKPVMISVLFITNIFLALMWWVGDLGVALGALMFGLGTVRFAINNLTQAASLDVAEGRRLEGSMIGLLWGNNALFGSFSPLLLGVIIVTVGSDDFGTIFPYAVVLHVLTLITAFFLPNIGGRVKAKTA